MSATDQDHGILAVIPEGLFTRAQVADMVGRSQDTIRRWHYSGRFVPSHHMQLGDLTVWLYTVDDVRALHNIVTNMKIGRPPKRSAA